MVKTKKCKKCGSKITEEEDTKGRIFIGCEKCNRWEIKQEVQLLETQEKNESKKIKEEIIKDFDNDNIYEGVVDEVTKDLEQETPQLKDLVDNQQIKPDRVKLEKLSREQSNGLSNSVRRDNPVDPRQNSLTRKSSRLQPGESKGRGSLVQASNLGSDDIPSGRVKDLFEQIQKIPNETHAVLKAILKGPNHKEDYYTLKLLELKSRLDENIKFVQVLNQVFGNLDDEMKIKIISSSSTRLLGKEIKFIQICNELKEEIMNEINNLK